MQLRIKKAELERQRQQSNLSACLAEAGQKVLTVDFDPQGNASQGVGAAKADHQLTVYNMLMEEYEPDAVIRTF